MFPFQLRNLGVQLELLLLRFSQQVVHLFKSTKSRVEEAGESIVIKLTQTVVSERVVTNAKSPIVCIDCINIGRTFLDLLLSFSPVRNENISFQTGQDDQRLFHQSV